MQRESAMLVIKIGSMALINPRDQELDYNIFARLGRALKPGMVLVSSGAVEIGRLDYIRRRGAELAGDFEENKADYAAEGQAILMREYRRFLPHHYALRQLLLEHTHFNDPEKREFISQFLLRCEQQGAVPIVNYNDAVSVEEVRKMELFALRQKRGKVVECIDNDETAAVVAELVRADTLVLLTNVNGIYLDPGDPSTLVSAVEGATPEEVAKKARDLQAYCHGASRAAAAGARAKLQFIETPILHGTRVIIANAKYALDDILAGRVERSLFQVRP